MSVEEIKTLRSLVKNGWKKLALADQTCAEEILEILKATLEGMDELEESAEEE